jgi:hypothetical protein
MVVTYSVLSILCALISVVLLWSESPMQALALGGPFIAIAGVLLGVHVALSRPNAETSFGASTATELDPGELRSAA